MAHPAEVHMHTICINVTDFLLGMIAGLVTSYALFCILMSAMSIIIMLDYERKEHRPYGPAWYWKGGEKLKSVPHPRA